MNLQQLQTDLQNLSNMYNVQILQRFFKTGPGQYGEGDLFRGIKVPQLRKLVDQYFTISLENTTRLLHSPYHEDRLCALLILVRKMKTSDENCRSSIFNAYMSNSSYVNNWDLVDLSAAHISGSYLFDKSKRPLYQFAKSKLLWERRIALLSTFHYIKKNHFEDTLAISKLLLNDKEDLIHKAVGWMLREIGKRDSQVEIEFITANYSNLPRTTLRYAIERFPEVQRKKFLKGVF